MVNKGAAAREPTATCAVRLSDLQHKISAMEDRLTIVESTTVILDTIKTDIHDLRLNSEVMRQLTEQRIAFEKEKKSDLKIAQEDARRREERRDKFLLAFCGFVVPLAVSVLYYALDHRIYTAISKMTGM